MTKKAKIVKYRDGETVMEIASDFESWMIDEECKSENTASSYKSHINEISRHYSQVNKDINLYKTTDIQFIKSLAKDYGKKGRYRDIGEKGMEVIEVQSLPMQGFLKITLKLDQYQ